MLPTVHAWPAAAEAVAALLSQTGAPPFEVLLLDGSEGGALATPPLDPAVRWLRFPGYDSFALRAAGVAAARGAIVAVSEDHCIAASDWVASIAAAHRASATPVMVGATVNHPASASSAMDRANFLLTFAAQNLSRLDLGVRKLPVPTNVSFKREALPAAGLKPGELEYDWLARMRDAGGLGASRSIVLEHKQCWGPAAPGVHMASGRSYGAAVHAARWRHRLHWWLALPLLPLRLAALVAPDLLRGASGRRPSPADVFSVAALIMANVWGQILGVVSGPGASRKRL